MTKRIFKIIIIVLVLMGSVFYLGAQQKNKNAGPLQQQYNLAIPHSKDEQYFEMESRLQKFALDGSPNGTDTYRLWLRCVPTGDTLKGDEYTCIKFEVQVGEKNKSIAIPSLAGFSYFFSLTENSSDTNRKIFGIDNKRFENLKDQNGKPLSIENNYHVYNSFIDFHSMNVFFEKTATGKGVQDLKYIGDKIIHSASYSQPQVNLGSQVAKGSYFKNGEITLLFKGLSLINARQCAVLEYDSGESSFYMLMKPMANMDVVTKGRSHYWGDIYKDISTGWMQQATLHELVISETVVSGQTNKINAVIERSISIKNVKK